MSSGKIMKPKNKNFYMKNNRKKSNNIDVNFKGFLCSCNNREKDCIKESYNILNKAAEELYGSTKEETEKLEDVQETDISDEIAKEVEDLKSDNTNSKHKFNSYDSGAKNLVFIRTRLENPVEIAEHIVKNVYDTKQQQTRFLIRLVPIETTCKAYINDIEKAFEPLAEKHFKNDAKTFSIVYNHRNNNSLSKDEVIKKLQTKFHL
ncbi:hypothetical protein HHI36_020486 [Cryptolaemus montrouzieri]|uniref:THUMP domain-containing protein n=1 Tax=Cryptolaemus montrouzieri TaxID=559131 RepID=A0ABD2NB54_9CUCU